MVERNPGSRDAWKFVLPGDTGYSTDFKVIRKRLRATAAVA